MMAWKVQTGCWGVLFTTRPSLLLLKCTEQRFIGLAVGIFIPAKRRYAQYWAKATEYGRVRALACHAPVHTCNVTQRFSQHLVRTRMFRKELTERRILGDMLRRTSELILINWWEKIINWLSGWSAVGGDYCSWSAFIKEIVDIYSKTFITISSELVS